MNELIENIPFINKHLSRKNINTTTKALRIIFILLALLLLFLIIKLLISNILLVGGEIAKQENDLSKKLNSIKSNLENKTTDIKKDYNDIGERSPFGNLEIERVSSSGIKKVEKKISDLKLELIGTFITNGKNPYAIIEDSKKNEQEIFEIDDNIFDVAKLVAIFTDRVEIDRDGKIEILQLDSAPNESSSYTGGDTISVKEELVNEALNNLPLLLTQARAVPYFKNGKSVGLRLFAIKRGSLYETIGLKNGDILKQINGNNLGDITQAVKLFEKLKQERSISLELERNRADKTIRYEIE